MQTKVEEIDAAAPWPQTYYWDDEWKPQRKLVDALYYKRSTTDEQLWALPDLALKTLIQPRTWANARAGIKRGKHFRIKRMRRRSRSWDRWPSTIIPQDYDCDYISMLTNQEIAVLYTYEEKSFKGPDLSRVWQIRKLAMKSTRIKCVSLSMIETLRSLPNDDMTEEELASSAQDILEQHYKGERFKTVSHYWSWHISIFSIQCVHHGKKALQSWDNQQSSGCQFRISFKKNGELDCFRLRYLWGDMILHNH